MDLSPAELLAQAKEIGIAISGQTADLAPADKVMYALRDAIGAVSSMPLIVSSILSKKLAGGAELVSLDVKCGSGAFMPDFASAQALAQLLSETAKRCGLQTTVAITDMSQPLGHTVGNAIEIREAIETLNGKPGRFRDLCIELVAHTLQACGKGSRQEAVDVLDSGRARSKAKEWFKAQGANPDLLDDPSPLSLAPCTLVAEAPEAGWIARVDAGTVGYAVIEMGGGRHKKEDSIDPAVGVEFSIEVGDRIEKGQPIFSVYARDDASARTATASIVTGIKIESDQVPKPTLILAEM